jgi:signal transduction histidine kinase
MKTAMPSWGAARRALTVLAIVLVASGLTVLLESYIRFAGFVFFYGAVVASAVYAGVLGGAVATVVGILVVQHELVPPGGAFTLQPSEGYVAIFAFAAVSMLVTMLAQSVRAARHTAEVRAEELGQQTAELEMQRREAQALAEELEASNVELEATTDDAKRARDAAVAGEARLRLVDEASRVLTSSLDYETTVAAVARLAVPDFADWCGVDLIEDGEIKRLAVAHVDPEKVRWAREVVDVKFRPDPDAATGVPAVIRTGKPVLLPVVTDEMLEESARNREHLSMLRSVGVHSVIVVPIIARATTLGALTLISSRPTRHFDDSDLAIAQELARRAAVAIDNARLYRAALAANEAKANFLATMSHELRTPLTAIIGYEELLSEGISGPVNEGQQQQLRRIKVSANQLLSLIDQILLFTRVETGHALAEIEPVVVKEIVDDAVALVLPEAAERALTVRTDLADPALVMHTDGLKLRQILTNLLANAVKFSSNGEVAVRVKQSADQIVFEVQDSGVGIDQAHLERIFEPFWQVEQTTTRASGGSGLGLTVTKRLARLLGGTVQVESELGKGSTFRVTLPRDLTPTESRML